MNGRQAGFTLIEVMIAITVMAILSVICWRALDSVTRTEERLRNADAELTADLRVLQQLQRDIEMRADDELRNGMLKPADAPQRLLPPSLVSTRDPGGHFTLEITRRVGSAGDRWQRVRWYQQGATLRRASGAPGVHYPLPVPEPGSAVIVAEGVTRFDMRAWQPRSGWTALPMQQDALPAQGVELTVQLADRQYRRVLPL